MTTDENYLVVVNPVGRGGKALERGTWLLNKLQHQGVSHEAVFTEKAGHARELVSSWVDPVDTVVAVGGDGTVNEVINGIIDSGHLDRKLAVLPSGTADDFARNMKIPDNREKALAAILGESDKTIDLMLVNDRYASVTVGIGLDAEIAHRTYRSKRFRLLAYWYHGLSMLFKPIPRSPLTIDIGEYHMRNDFLLIVAGNAGDYGRYMNMIPEARMDDGIINLVTADMMNQFKALLLFLLSFCAWHRWARELTFYSGTEMVIECMDDVYAQFDGEVVTYDKGSILDMKVEPLVLKVKVPEHKKRRS
ncbi:MAG: diacylglycerol kinase family lipid kinase [Actinobacteria bacterium]|nr:diacylglycerol kinase family lipid kinase [Actinomycetota bacterium]